MGKTWKNLLRSVAPLLGAAVGGPVGGIAVKALSGALGLEEDSSERTVAKAIKNASPADLIKLKSAEQQFKLDMAQAGIDLVALDVEDRADARAREIATKDNTPKILASVIVLGFFGTLFYMLTNEIPVSSQTPFNILLGALTAMLVQVGNYYFGSSDGSAKKNKIIAEQRE